MNLHGIEVRVEVPKGHIRNGVNPDGTAWSAKMPADYGRIVGTKGADRAPIDVYLGPHVKGPKVYIVNQNDAESGDFDEHKVFLGFNSKRHVVRTYVAAFSDGKAGDRLGHVAELDVPEFKEWLKSDTSKPHKFAAGGGVQDLPDAPWASSAETLPDAPWAPAPPAKTVSTVADVGKGLVSGIGKGATYLAGLPGDAAKLMEAGGEWVGNKMGLKPLPEDVKQQLHSSQPFSSGEIQKGIEGVTGEFYEPQTTPGKYAHTAGEFVPGAAMGPLSAGRSLLGNLMRYAAVPAIASETAGQLTEGSAAEPYARAAAAIGTGGILAARDRPVIPATVNAGTNTAPSMGIRLSEGQANRSHDAIMMEQAALRGGLGPRAQQIAQDFFENQRGDIEQARIALARNLDQFGTHIADSPLAAGELVSQTLQNVAQQSKRGYQGLYDEFSKMPGEIHAGAVEGIGQKIKGALTLRENPVVIDDVTTPVASRAIKDIDEYIGQMRIQNRADPFGPPNVENIVGVSLKGIDQARKRLVSMRGAVNPQNPTDRRAMDQIIHGFDDQVESAISRGLFTGDDRALPVLQAARAEFAQHQRTFTGKGVADPLNKQVGRAVSNIVGHEGGQGATANEVANYLYGESKIGAKGLSSRLATRVRDIVGGDSPEWSGVRQGMWHKLTQAPEGQTPWGTQKIAQRVTDFLNGSGRATAQVVFTPQERQQMARFARSLNEVTPPQSTINWSNTATVGSRMAAHAMGGIQRLLGMATHSLGPIGSEMASRIGANFIQGGRNARQIRRTLYGQEQRPITPDVRKNLLTTGALGAEQMQP